jgi:hypothetical protein
MGAKARSPEPRSSHLAPGANQEAAKRPPVSNGRAGRGGGGSTANRRGGLSSLVACRLLRLRLSSRRD